MATNQEVHDYIMSYINSSGIEYANWYVGIAADARARLFTDHKVNEASGRWIWKRANSSDDARAIEKVIIETYGTKGGPGGGDASTDCVYAYAITATTVEAT